MIYIYIALADYDYLSILLPSSAVSPSHSCFLSTSHHIGMLYSPYMLVTIFHNGTLHDMWKVMLVKLIR